MYIQRIRKVKNTNDISSFLPEHTETPFEATFKILQIDILNLDSSF